MFAHPLTNLQGFQAGAPGQAHFQAALTALQPINPEHLDQRLETALDFWTKGGAELTAAANYQAEEKYCVRQSVLWRLYAVIETAGLGAEISRTIFNRARTVIEETPLAARPVDLSFLEGENLIRRTLEHLRTIEGLYQALASPASSLTGGEGALPPSPGFQVLTVIEGTTDPAQAEQLLKRFLGDNKYVRSILLGDDAIAASDVVDNCIFDPAPGAASGRAIWVKSHTLLRASISTWLGAVLPHDYPQLRCIFISPKGKPSSFLAKTDPLNFTTVSLKIVQALQADPV